MLSARQLINVPKELYDLITVLQFQLPIESEINYELKRLIESLNIEIDQQVLESLTRACQGLSLERIRRVLSKIIATYKTIDENSINLLLNEKKQIISRMLSCNVFLNSSRIFKIYCIHILIYVKNSYLKSVLRPYLPQIGQFTKS